MTMPTYLELNPWHKRQATLLYHFTSMEYLKALLPMVEGWIAYTDGILTERSALDTVGLAQANWKPVHTTAHFSTYAFAAMVELKEAVQRSIAARTYERYSDVGEYQCSRMLQEYAGMTGRENGDFLWATPEQEAGFKQRFDAIYRHASQLTASTAPMRTSDDYLFWILWQDYRANFPKLPRFRVRTDVVGESGKFPPRTGVYVPQDEPYGALQFSWISGVDGKLGDAYVLSEIGYEALNAVGRQGLWGDETGLFHFATSTPYSGVIRSIFPGPLTRENFDAYNVAEEAFSSKPCKWYFVEMVNDEYEDHDGTYAGTGADTSTHRQNVPAGQPVPQSGWWSTPASREPGPRYLQQGEIFPDFPGSSYGATFWQWSPDQSRTPPR